MPSASFGRRRERQTVRPKNFIDCGVLRKRNASNHAILQTIKFSPAAWPYVSNEVTWDTIHKGPPFLTGGNFASIKSQSDANTIKGVGVHKGTVQSGGYYWEYTGGFIRPTTSQDLSTMGPALDFAVDDPYQVGYLDSNEALGPQAFDRLRPRLGEVGGFVAIAELRDLPKMLRTSAMVFKNQWEDLTHTTTRGYRRQRLIYDMSNVHKTVADNFLNHAFGWAPFISDLSKTLETLKHQRKIMEQMSRDNGNWIKRARTMSQTNAVTSVRSGYAGGLPWRSEFDSMCNNINPSQYSPYQWSQTDSVEEQTWAVGQFSYYRPEYDLNRTDYLDGFNQLRRVLTLYGVRVNPSTLWQITPWSWLIDWFTGFGSWLSRVTSIVQDDIAAKYLYIMKTSHKVTQHDVTVNWKDGPRSFSWKNEISSKQREEANNPFGFTLPSGGLSAKQIAIMAALGLSRSKPLSGAP
jgi:hypothetical protein